MKIMDHNLVFKDRAFRLDVLISGDKFLCRFPRRNGRSSYLDLSFFNSIEFIDPAQYRNDTEGDDVIHSQTSCIVAFQDGEEFELDCTPDQFVDILKLYRQFENAARNFI